jgi:hypothetical protein
MKNTAGVDSNEEPWRRCAEVLFNTAQLHSPARPYNSGTSLKFLMWSA